jgi:hypothetical protein
VREEAGHYTRVGVFEDEEAEELGQVDRLSCSSAVVVLDKPERATK